MAFQVNPSDNIRGRAVAEWVGALDWVRMPLRQLRSGTLAIPFTQLCQCLSEETLKAVSPFYLVSMPGEVKDPTSLHWKCVTCVTTTLLEKDNSDLNGVTSPLRVKLHLVAQAEQGKCKCPKC